jgi:1-aminocyclopropane-1-carboxylate deaminase/D-cysteine desulfhydrase-like pyridoxal-dependent ACC family enzyme
VLSLFKKYPLLGEKLPYVSLTELPTPVQRLTTLGRELGTEDLYVKCDNVSGKVYGGNKPRKLEFLLGEALRTGAKEVMTFGGAGSNHALATAIYTQQLGLKCISMLMSQPNARYVRRNLLLDYYYGAELHHCGTTLESKLNEPLSRIAASYQMFRHRIKSGTSPMLIPPGGSSPLGAVGFVNAAFELAEQVENREMPEPDCIYVATGSRGTAAGLLLGLRAAGLKSRLVSVAVTDKAFINAGGIIDLAARTNSLLHSEDPSFPEFKFSEEDTGIRHDFFGERYAQFTEEGLKAVALAKRTEGIKLEGTYTGKTFAALIADARNEMLEDKVTLFWNTYSSSDFSAVTAVIDYHKLPRSFQRYFEQEVQPLDKDL